ncbi:MAG TPA: glucose-6-phosphate isomerase [Gemmatimonadaceae bacterium]|nr:glucose-6-phosphate isomerase [Gemmatimonadaceae bacterium]
MAITLDFTNMIAGAGLRPDPARDVGTDAAIDEREWSEARSRFAEAHATVVARHLAGELGFLDLPDDTGLHAQVTGIVDRLITMPGGRRSVADVVVLGIGGSALGPVALRTALRAPGWNLLDEGARGGYPRLHVLDNVDPVTIAATLDRLDLARSLFVVISKSGGTAETLAQYLVVRERLERTLGSEAGRRLVFVTDPRKGALRAIAEADGIVALDIPANVGGRFSVLSPVGLLPAALIGIPTAELLDGAADMRTRCATSDVTQNPAGAFATLQWLAHARHGCGIHVMMPYSDPLRDFAAWFVQLWAESLGKRGADGRGVGPTPIAALGATDQHSQVQLFMEGPVDKTVTFLAVGATGRDLEIPRLHGEIPELSYLGGHQLGELLDIERRATAGALARRGRPNLTIGLDTVDPWHVGGLIMLLELATVYAGALYGVNPLDQPGVELGKQFTYAMLGRADATAAREEWNLLPKADPRWTV